MNQARAMAKQRHGVRAETDEETRPRFNRAVPVPVPPRMLAVASDAPAAPD